MGRVLFFAILLLLTLARVEAIDISAVGGWGETIDASDLVSGAGSDLIDTYESTTDATVIDISNCVDKFDAYRVDVRRVDGTWHADFTLYVRRTTVGIGPGSIKGGTAYFEITVTDSEFFTGKGDRINIDVQYQLTGMSVSVSPNTYSTTVVFTVVDN
ncbi:MAG: hypothetical protein WBD28_09055 [Candidatus Zixiibacteriota bacterium]